MGGHVQRARGSDEFLDGLARTVGQRGRRRAAGWHGPGRGTGCVDEPCYVRAGRQDLIGRLGGTDPLHLDQVAHRDQACDRVVVVEPVAGRRAFGVNDPVAAFPDPDRGDAQSTARGGLLDGVHGLCTIAHAELLTNYGHTRYSRAIP